MTKTLYIIIGISLLVAAIVAVLLMNVQKNKDENKNLIVKMTADEAYGGDITKETFITKCMDGCYKNCDPNYKCDPRNCELTCDNNWENYNAKKDIWTRLNKLGL
jgi:type II secretory pathway pseudopilin PulG